MLRPTEKLCLVLALAAAFAGCKPKIGDSCKISTDCSTTGDRLCDITAPGGYCTMFNCEPGTCPTGESLCVEFGAERTSIKNVDPNSALAACIQRESRSPYARAFCMATCSDDSDCRSGYVCRDLSVDNEWGAVLIDSDRGNKACLVPVSAGDQAEAAGGAGFGDVCKTELNQAGAGQ
jgi:hypothetical protein